MIERRALSIMKLSPIIQVMTHRRQPAIDGGRLHIESADPCRPDGNLQQVFAPGHQNAIAVHAEFPHEEDPCERQPRLGGESDHPRFGGESQPGSIWERQSKAAAGRPDASRHLRIRGVLDRKIERDPGVDHLLTEIEFGWSGQQR